MEYWDEIIKLTNVWYGMHHRCYNKKIFSYKDYGGRGITVCDEWKDKKTFFKWAFINGWQPKLLIDRINNNLGYYPENCRFVTPKVSNQNQRSSKRWHIKGKLFNSCPEAAKYFNTTKQRIERWCYGHGTKENFHPREPDCWAEKLY